MATFHFYPPVAVSVTPPAGSATEQKQDDIIDILTDETLSILRGAGGTYSKTQVVKDTTTPLNTIPLPVEIVSASGTEINITSSGDVNIVVDGTGPNPSSIQLTNGTEFVDVTADRELVVHDEKVLLELEKITDEIAPGDGLKVTVENTADFASSTEFDGFTRVDPSVTTINDAGYAEIVASAPQDYKGFKVFQQGGNNIIFALGAASAEENKYLIHPGDLSEVRMTIPAGTRISLRSLQGTVNATQIIFNWLV